MYLPTWRRKCKGGGFHSLDGSSCHSGFGRIVDSPRHPYSICIADTLPETLSVSFWSAVFLFLFLLFFFFSTHPVAYMPKLVSHLIEILVW